MNFDPAYQAIEGYSNEISDAENGCPASAIFRDGLEAVGGVAATAALAVGGAEVAGRLSSLRGGAPSSTYVEITTGGSVRNIGTSVTHTEFADTLSENGWTSSISKDGKTEVFQKGGAKYVLRKEADSYDGWNADFTPAGSTKITVKIRLGYPVK